MHRESVFLLFFFFSLPPPCNNIHRIHRIKEVYEEEEYFSEKFKKHLTASKLSPWKSNIVFRELFHYSRSTRIFKMGNKKKEEERRERKRMRDEQGWKNSTIYSPQTWKPPRNVHSSMRIHSTRCSYYTCKKRASSSDAARSLLRIFVLHSPWRFKRSPEVSRSLRHLIFIRSRKQCRANRCQLRHSGFWLSSQIIAGGNRCLANKLRMNHSWERPFGVHGKIALTCTFECPAWQLSWDQVPFCFFFYCYLRVKWRYFLANLDGIPIPKKNKLYKIEYDPSRSLFWKIVNQKSCLKKRKAILVKVQKVCVIKKEQKNKFSRNILIINSDIIPEWIDVLPWFIIRFQIYRNFK